MEMEVSKRENMERFIQLLESEEALSEDTRHEIAHALKKADEKLKKNNAWFNSAGRMANLGLWEMDLFNDELIWSDEIYEIFEFDPGAFSPSYSAFLERVHPEDRERLDRVYFESLEKRESYQIIHRLQFPDGRIKYVEEHAEHFYSGKTPVRSIGTVQDITDQELDRQKLKESLNEKKVLLSEIHHRVKNNLALVSGFLQLQWLKENNPETASKLRDSLNRIKTIAKIHEQLYRSGRFSEIALDKNIEMLSEALVREMETGKKLPLSCYCEKVFLHMSQALPCSLLVNEIVTNIMKYAGDDDKTGKIKIHLSEENERIGLRIRDEGTRLPDDFMNRKRTLGITIIETLTRQLDADFEFNTSKKETTFSVRFKREKFKSL